MRNPNEIRYSAMPVNLVGAKTAIRQSLVDHVMFQQKMLKKRYVKRLIRKIIFLVIAIVLISLLTSAIVEKRLKNQRKTEGEVEVATDFNGDPVTKQLSRFHKIDELARKPRPPVRQKHFEDKPEWTPPSVQSVPSSVDGDVVWFAGSEFEITIPNWERKDWHDYAAMEADRQRVGPGEQGQGVNITDESLKEKENKLYRENGFNALISDMISVNRSIPDVRNEGCLSKKYFVKLPNISVVIPFYNEYLSTLFRTLYSIINRTPRELLKEIIIVDDFSDREYLGHQLDNDIETYFKDLVKIVRLPQRMGLISARLAGAKVATGDVLVFFDSHIECNYNWLPPLLEPIAINRKISTCPIVDGIEHATFAYSGGYQQGSRGSFDWDLHYKQLPLLPEDAVDKTRPTRNPVMMGGLFAIGREFFWELGGYDEGLDIWGAEQFELSFKVWMCGGMVLDTPCSRVAHVFRGPMDARKNPRQTNFIAINQKRVAEVWMDEYKKYLYAGEPETYETLDPGDLTKQREVRERLKCKSFKWFLEVVAPDTLKAFPPIPPPNYASGTIESLAYPGQCLDTLNGGDKSIVGIYACAENRTNPQKNQHWELSWYHDLRINRSGFCLDVYDSSANATIWMLGCHNLRGNQYWYYNRKHQWLVHGEALLHCLEILKDKEQYSVVMNECDPSNVRMKWEFGYVNDTALERFFDE